MAIAETSKNNGLSAPGGDNIRVLVQAAAVIDLLSASDKPVSLTALSNE
ncbi:MAG: hypothetical protein LBS67_02990 [Clostridiales Family XIII bacterium]|jgi:hypothetical protein|nr:hypothetical protein [Clostridiales Family XIII bacterium]